VKSAHRSAHRAHHHTGAPAAPGAGTAAKHAPAKKSPHTTAKHAPAKTGPKQGAHYAPQPPSAPGAGVVRFGTVTSENSTASIDVSDDGKALTAGFSDLEADLEKGVPSTGTRMVMPLTGGARNATITVYASGYVFTHHATARLSFTVNGTTVVRDFPSGTDREFVQPIELPAIGGSAYQLSLTLEGQQAPASADGTAYINVSTIDAEIS
jgi:hypothetical protein